MTPIIALSLLIVGGTLIGVIALIFFAASYSLPKKDGDLEEFINDAKNGTFMFGVFLALGLMLTVIPGIWFFLNHQS